MNKTRLKPAELAPEQVARLRDLEHELGSVVIAYQPESPYARLTPEQVTRLQALEHELGLVLLAYNPKEAAVGG